VVLPPAASLRPNLAMQERLAELDMLEQAGTVA
jgi:hypothetical protein